MGKKNLRRIPDRVLARVNALDSDDVVAACAKLIRHSNIAQYAHLGLSAEAGAIVVPPTAPPPVTSGRYSERNLNGQEVVRRDLPMTSRANTFETPNFGDWSRGSHEITWYRPVYQREFVPPKELEIKVEILRAGDSESLVKFEIDQVLNRTRPTFHDDLLFNLNLLQENVGAADVFASAATLEEYAHTIHVDWQILPPGTVDEVLRGILDGGKRGKQQLTPEQETVMRERLAALQRLEPEAYIAGTDKFLRYFGARFGDDLVAFENIRYGNAIYLMRENWPDLSRRSRLELLKGRPGNVDRIVHSPGWEERLSVAVAEYRHAKR